MIEEPIGIFGIPLATSIKYANVAISLTDENGQSFIYGYVPIVVAKCGVFLKEKGKFPCRYMHGRLLILFIATDVEGIFRLSGSAKRIKELQVIFDSPDRYGKGLDWTGYTVHDAANILRRYLTRLPQPIIPLDFYEPFRKPLRSHQAQAVGDVEAQGGDLGDFDHDTAIATYQKLIVQLPPLNRQLLLYILDLLAVFASKSDLNLMTSANLSAIFQPGLLSHPTHDMKPEEYRLSQDVLIFLIDNQDSFLIGMNGTAADEKTVKEVQSGPQARQPITPLGAKNVQSGLGRSASNASAGADSLRKFGGVRRNVSVSSKNSKTSASPGTPTSGVAFPGNNGSGVYRSNTVPSKKSPGLSSSRFQRGRESPAPPSPNTGAGSLLSPGGRTASPSSKLASPLIDDGSRSPTSSLTPTPTRQPIATTQNEPAQRDQSKERLLPKTTPNIPPSQATEDVSTPTKERKMGGIFGKSPTSDSERLEPRPPNKLKKKRIPSSTNPSAHSSTHSLNHVPDSPSTQHFFTPMPTPGANQMQVDPMTLVNPTISNTAPTPSSERPPNLGSGANSPYIPDTRSPPQQEASNLRPRGMSGSSANSKTSATSASDVDRRDDSGTKPEKLPRKHRFRFASSANKRNAPSASALTGESSIGANVGATTSTSSVGSWARPRRSTANDEHPETPMAAVAPSTPHEAAFDGSSQPKREHRESNPETEEKRGPINWFKNKVAQAKEERQAREAEKERAKSPQRHEASERSGSKHSLAAIAQDSSHGRGRSVDIKRELKSEKAEKPEKDQ